MALSVPPKANRVRNVLHDLPGIEQKPSAFSLFCDVYGSIRGMQILSLGRIFFQTTTPSPADSAGLAYVPLSRFFVKSFLDKPSAPHRKLKNWPLTAFGLQNRRLSGYLPPVF